MPASSPSSSRHLQLRKDDRPDDLISQLVHSSHDGEPIEDGWSSGSRVSC